MKMMNQRGFTLVEMLIAVAIGIFLTIVTLSENVTIFENQMYSVTHSNLDQDALLEASYLALQMEGIGGGAVRSWMAIWVENASSAAPLPPRGPFLTSSTSDRLTISTSLPSPLDCPITGILAPNKVQIANIPTCCLTSNTPTQMMFTNNNSYSQVYASVIDTGACTVTYGNGQASGNNSVPATGWSTGIASVVTVQTYYVDPTKNQMWVWSDTTNSGVITPNNSVEMAANVYDFQVALGFDVNGNNVITDNGNTSDNWLYNAVGDPALGAAGVFLNTTMPQLRMVAVGVVAGTPTNFENGQAAVTAQILDGQNNSAAAVDMKSILFKATPRNSFIFQ